VTFGTTYRSDFDPAFDFQSRAAPNNLPEMLKKINCTGGTNAAAGFSLGWSKLKALNDRGALNAIVFFTDGQPNTLHLPAIQMKGSKAGTTGYCSNTGPRNGVLATTGNPSSDYVGIYQPYETLFPLANTSTADLRLITTSNPTNPSSSGCRYVSDQSDVSDDIIGLAPSTSEVDAWGNSLVGYKPSSRSGGLLQAGSNGQYLEYAGINALDNAATRARAEAAGLDLELVVYTVGLASPNPAEDLLLKRIANTRDSNIFDPTKKEGIYAYASNPTELEAAFASMASDILRISK
jgi:hypothetical protein